MKETINFNRFCDAFKEMRKDDNFSYEGKKALYNYLTDLEDDTNKEIELDVISLCCGYIEYKNLNEYLNYYYTTEEINEKIENHKQDTEEETKEAFKVWIEEEINDKTNLIKFSNDLDDGFIIQSY